MQSQCLVVLYEDAEANGAEQSSGFAVHDMAAGGDILFYLRDMGDIYDSMCALQPLHFLRSVCAHHRSVIRMLRCAGSPAQSRRSHC